jgi:hypothetical protein
MSSGVISNMELFRSAQSNGSYAQPVNAQTSALVRYLNLLRAACKIRKSAGRCGTSSVSNGYWVVKTGLMRFLLSNC